MTGRHIRGIDFWSLLTHRQFIRRHHLARMCFCILFCCFFQVGPLSFNHDWPRSWSNCQSIEVHSWLILRILFCAPHFEWSWPPSRLKFEGRRLSHFTMQFSGALLILTRHVKLMMWVIIYDSLFRCMCVLYSSYFYIAGRRWWCKEAPLFQASGLRALREILHFSKVYWMLIKLPSQRLFREIAQYF